jgi:hypothetical protein
VSAASPRLLSKADSSNGDFRRRLLGAREYFFTYIRRVLDHTKAASPKSGQAEHLTSIATSTSPIGCPVPKLSARRALVRRCLILIQLWLYIRFPHGDDGTAGQGTLAGSAGFCLIALKHRPAATERRVTRQACWLSGIALRGSVAAWRLILVHTIATIGPKRYAKIDNEQRLVPTHSPPSRSRHILEIN